MAWNCDLSPEQLAEWRRRYRVRLYPDAWQEWVLAVNVPADRPLAAARTLADDALAGYWGAEVPIVGRSGGDRGDITDLELTVQSDQWVYEAPSNAQAVTAIDVSDRPTIKLDRSRLVFVLARFVYRGSAADLPWMVWDFAPAGAAAVGGVGWDPECPLLADVVLTSAAPLPTRAVPSAADAQPVTWRDRATKAAADVGSGLQLIGWGVLLLGAAWLLGGSRRR